MKIDLLYGRDGLCVGLPDDIGVTVVRKHAMTPLADPEERVHQALDSPVESKPLSELARGKRTVCILICDITRPVPNGTLLPPLIRTLTSAGINTEEITILVATGLHRPNEGQELAEIVGSDEIMRSIRVENHFARDRNAHRELGKTAGGIPISVDRRFADADLRIVTGLVEPHFMAGYSGGRKVVAPGVAYQDTILMFHTARILEHPKAANCVLDGNPLHKEQLEIVHALGEVFALNVVIDEKREIGFVNFGDIEASHCQAVEFMRRYAEVPLPRQFKTVVATSAGYPLDRTYYQTVKGMVGVTDIVAPGGTIIIASECSEGMGSPEFVEAQRLLCEVGPKRFMDILADREKARIDEWQTEMLIKALRVGNIQLYAPDLSEEDRKIVYVEPIASVERAIADSSRTNGPHEIAVVPEGPYVVPRFDHKR